MSLACSNLVISDTGPRKACDVTDMCAYMHGMNVYVRTYVCKILRFLTESYNIPYGIILWKDFLVLW